MVNFGPSRWGFYAFSLKKTVLSVMCSKLWGQCLSLGPACGSLSKTSHNLLLSLSLFRRSCGKEDEEEIHSCPTRISRSSVHSLMYRSKASQASQRRPWVWFAGAPGVRSQSIHIYDEMSLPVIHPGSLLLNVCTQGEVIPAADCYVAEEAKEKGGILAWIIYYSSASVVQGSMQKVAYFQVVSCKLNRAYIELMGERKKLWIGL